MKVSKRHYFLPFLILTICCLFQFKNSINFSWSFDDSYILNALPENKDFKSTFEVFKKTFDLTDYRPISSFTFALEQWYNERIDSKFSHKVNLVIYALSIFLIYIFLVYLLKLNFDDPYLLAFLITLIFLFHPLHTSIVVNLKNRDGLLSMIFGILSTIYFIKYLSNLRVLHLLFFLIFLLLAFLSKIDVIGFLFIFILYVFLFYIDFKNLKFKVDINQNRIFSFFQKNENDKVQWFELAICIVLYSFSLWDFNYIDVLSLLLIFIVFFKIKKRSIVNLFFVIFSSFYLIYGTFLSILIVFVCIVISNYNKLKLLKTFLIIFLYPVTLVYHVYYFRFKFINQALNIPIIEHPINFTENPLIQNPGLSFKLSQAIQTYFQYIKFMIVPKGYYFYFGYDMLPLRPLFHPLTILMLLAILVFIAIIYYLGKYNKLAWFGGAWFFSTLLYASNLVMPVAGIIADRYAYIASLGFCMVLVVGVFWLSDKIVNIFKLNQNEITANQMEVKKKKSKHTTEEKIIHKMPISNKIAISFCVLICLIYMPFNFIRANQWKDIYTLLEADMPHLSKSYEAHRIASSTYIQKGMDNISDVELAKSDFQKGEEFVDKALAIYDGDALLNESKLIVTFRLGRNKEAIEQAKKIAARFNYSKISRDLLSEYYFSEGKYDSSAFYYKELIRLIPEDISLYYKYTNVLRMANKAEEAVSFSNSIRNNKSLPAYLPDECIFYVYYYNNQMDQALGYFTAAYDKGLRNRELEYTIIDYYVRAGNKSVVETLKKKLNI